MSSFLFDTNVLIDYLRGNPEAASYVNAVIDGAEPGYLSAITLVELGRALRNKKEQLEIDALTSRFQIVPFTSEIAVLARDLSSNEGLEIGDAIIVASAIHVGATLLTADRALTTSLNNRTVQFLSHR